MPISAFGSKSGLTSCYIRKQITINSCRDIPTFSPSLNCHTNSDIPWDIPTFLLPFRWHTNSDTPWDIPTVLLPFNWHTSSDTLWDIPTFLPPYTWHTINDLPWDIPTFSSPPIRNPIGTLFVTSNLSAIIFQMFSTQNSRCERPYLAPAVYLSAFDLNYYYVRIESLLFRMVFGFYFNQVNLSTFVQCYP